MVILEYIENGTIDLVGSEAVVVEVEAGATVDQQLFVERVLALRCDRISIGERELSRMNELATVGFRAFDALHIACAESGRSDALLTTDDKFLRRAKRRRGAISVDVANPLFWLSEHFDNEHGLSDLE